MMWPYHIINFVSLVLIGVSLGFTIAWQDRKGKTWFVAFLALLLAERLASMVGMLLVQSGLIDYSSLFFKILMAISGFGSILSLVFLLVFVIVSKTFSPADVTACAVGTSSSSQTSEAKWSWSFIKGFVWALPVGGGALLGVKKALAYSVAFNNDYSLLYLVFGVTGLALWLGGLRRISKQHAEQEADIRERVANMQNPKNGQE
jgi:hypothetical protein